MAITKAQQRAIAQAWKERAEAYDLRPKTKKYLDAQWHFLSGACAALHYTDASVEGDKLSHRVPPMWIIAGISGRDPFEGLEESEGETP